MRLVQEDAATRMELEQRRAETSLHWLPVLYGVGIFALLDRFRPQCRLRHRWLVVSVVALIAARICWQLDVAGKFSDPDAGLQGHAVWHVLTGISLAGTYLFYRSEVCSS